MYFCINSDILTLSFLFPSAPLPLLEVSKPQAAGHAAEAEKTESAEAKTESAQSS